MIPVIFINCSSAPFLTDIILRRKLYETRTRNMLRPFQGMRVLLAETGGPVPMIRCSAVIGAPFPVRSRAEWSKYRRAACIPFRGPYDWRAGTKVKWLYPLTDVQPLSVPAPLPTDAVRHGRVWAEYETEVK